MGALGRLCRHGRYGLSSKIATSIPRDDRPAVRRRSGRALAVQLLGPLTVLGGLVWAVAQPYRIALLDRADRDLYDYLLQAPLLVVVVGVLFAFAIAPGLVSDLEVQESDDPAR
jgi:hypothetical protein